jgi:hypothetical protein
MAHTQAAPRPILVNWIYNDGVDGSNAFIERVLARPEDEERLRQRLLKLTDPSVDSRKRGAAPSTTSMSARSSPSPHRSRTSGASWTRTPTSPPTKRGLDRRPPDRSSRPVLILGSTLIPTFETSCSFTAVHGAS